jgi:hypothetical protein
LLRQHLPRDPSVSFLEVGCVPGGFLLWFHRALGYQVFGLDYIDDLASVADRLRRASLEQPHLYRGDIDSFQPGRCFDASRAAWGDVGVTSRRAGPR